jgi:hypothetical protein
MQGIKRKLGDTQKGMEDDVAKSLDLVDRNVEKMKTNQNRLDLACDDVIQVKASLAAQIIKDFMRFDNFIRQNEGRFQLFRDTPGRWDSTSAQVKKAELFMELRGKLTKFVQFGDHSRHKLFSVSPFLSFLNKECLKIEGDPISSNR